MLRSLLSVGLLVICALSFAGCVTNTTGNSRILVGPVRPATSPDRVRVYDQPPKHFERIALIEGRTVFDLRLEAARVGANGVLIAGVVARPGPTLAVGIGSSTVDYDRHGAFGYGTSVSYETPLSNNSVLQGSAIYVR